MEEESGASVLVNDTGQFYCTVSITGSEEQISNARLLLQMWYVCEKRTTTTTPLIIAAVLHVKLGYYTGHVQR